jgi:hypothetical protein
MSEINLSKSVHQKLMNKAKEPNRPFNELLQYMQWEVSLPAIKQQIL